MVKFTNKTARVISLPAINAQTLKTAVDRKFIDAKDAAECKHLDLVTLGPLEFVVVTDAQAKFMVDGHKPMEMYIEAGYLEIEEVDKAA